MAKEAIILKSKFKRYNVAILGGIPEKKDDGVCRLMYYQLYNASTNGIFQTKMDDVYTAAAAAPSAGHSLWPSPAGTSRGTSRAPARPEPCLGRDLTTTAPKRFQFRTHTPNFSTTRGGGEDLPRYRRNSAAENIALCTLKLPGPRTAAAETKQRSLLPTPLDLPALTPCKQEQSKYNNTSNTNNLLSPPPLPSSIPLLPLSSSC